MPQWSFRGAPQGASPESIVTNCGYRFRAPSLRSGPGMTTERSTENLQPSPQLAPAATTDFNPCANLSFRRRPMKPSLCPGASRVNRITIGPDRTIGFMGEEARTYATPAMIRDIEYTCRDLILEHADAGEDSVGMEVAVKHLAPTLMGMTVEITVRVVAVDGRKISFDVAVKDELDTVGVGTHTRFVGDKAKTFERIKAKAARFAAR